MISDQRETLGGRLTFSLGDVGMKVATKYCLLGSPNIVVSLLAASM